MQTEPDFEDLEEGELNSEEEGVEDQPPKEENDELSVDYEILQRPLKPTHQTLHNAADPAAGSSRTLGVGQQYQQVARPSRPVNCGVTEEEDDGLYDKSSSSSDDSDDDDGPSRRKCKRMPNHAFMTVEPFHSSNSVSNVEPATVTDNNNAFNSQAVAFQQKRKPNNVWAKVIQDEEVSDIFGKVNVEEYNDQHVLIDRGPESFSVKYKTRPRVRRRSDSSSVSGGGLSEHELEYLKGAPAPKDQQLEPEMKDGQVVGLVTRHGRRTASFLKRRNYNKKLRQKRNRKIKMVNKMQQMNPDELGHYIAEKLHEAKHNLITNAIKALGQETIITLFLKTTKIERRGGLMVLNKERRRTAGGVFFYLLRSDGKFPKKVVDSIFASDIANQRYSRKREHQDERKTKMAELKEKNAEHEKRLKETEAKSSNLDTVQVTDDMENDSTDDDDHNDEAASEDVDSDEFCGIGTGELDIVPPQDTRKIVGYEEQDYLDIYCDDSELM